MTRNFKAIGLAFVAVFAMSALAVSSAQAGGTEEFFHADAEHVVIKGEQVAGAAGVQSFKPNGSVPPVNCAKASFEGTVKGTKQHTDGSWETAEHVTVRPKYSECEFEGFAATVNTHNCHYALSPTTTDPTEHATVDVKECANGITISVPGLGVTIKVANQVIPTGVSYTNNASTPTSGRDVTVKATATGIDYTCEPVFLCALGGLGGSGSEATYNGSVTVKGFKFVSGNTADGYVTGEQVGVWHGKTGP